MKMKKGNAGLIAVCLLISLLAAVVLAGCGARTGEQVSLDKDGSAQDAVSKCRTMQRCTASG